MRRHPYLIEARRGLADRFETRHAGVISVVDGNGADIASAGDSDSSFPLRSALKPFQLLPYLLDDLHRTHPRGPDELPADLAVMMSSHAGEPMHTVRVAGILDSYGLDPGSLQCGAHWPYHAETRDTLLREGHDPNPLHSNCSGKHAGMLAVCKHQGWSIDEYADVNHPLQRRIHDIVVALSRESTIPLPVSIDGCSLPTFWVSMWGLARMYAALTSPSNLPAVEGRDIGELIRLLYQAGTQNPEMIGGTDRFDSRLIRAFEGRVFGKSGAAGVYAMAVASCTQYPSGLGIGFKIEDGDVDNRIRPMVACEVLKQLGIDPPGGHDMSALANPTIRNVRGIDVGEFRCVFQLD